MAGKGSRFKEAGFKVSKPLIAVGRQPMVVAACSSFPEADLWIFLSRKDDMSKHPIQDALQSHFTEDIKVIQVDYETSGQAATCLLAEKELQNDDHLLIASCDYKTIYSHDVWNNLIQDISIDAVIWTCRLGSNITKNPEAFAYCVTDKDNVNIKCIVEKRTISETPGKDPLVVGTFWFRRAADFIRSANQAISQDLNVNGEHYVANSMNLMLNEGKRIVIFDVEQWVSFGDPFELDLYYYWESFFQARNNIVRITL
jgi:dTDP-glucose pyrophosphorylase